MVGGSLLELRLLPQVKLVAMIWLKVALNTKKNNQWYKNDTTVTLILDVKVK
jgi:hypothetical protein